MDGAQANNVRAACVAELRLTSGVRIRLRQHVELPGNEEGERPPVLGVEESSRCVVQLTQTVAG
jgi:hypothetical protein